MKISDYARTLYILSLIHISDYWTPEHTNSKYASPAYNNFDGHSYYKDFTYIQIKHITLGYNFEKNFVQKLGLSGLGVNISVENPYTFCDIRSVLNCLLYTSSDVLPMVLKFWTIQKVSTAA